MKGYIGVDLLSGCLSGSNGTDRWSHISLPALWLIPKPVSTLMVMAQRTVGKNWRCLSIISMLSLPFANTIKAQIDSDFVFADCVCVQAYLRPSNHPQQMEQQGAVSLMTSLYFK